MTSASRSRDCHVQTKRNIPILLSAIKHDSTCISLGLPFSLACSNCGPTLDPLSMNRKVRQKKERHKSERRRCQQYWDTSWTQGKDATEGNTLKYRLTRSYLQIDSDVIIDYYEAYKNRKRKQDVYNPTENESQSNDPIACPPPVEGINTSVSLGDTDESESISEPSKQRPPLLLLEGMDKLAALEEFISYFFPRSSGKHDTLTIVLQVLTNRSKERTRALLRKHTAKIEGDEEKVINISEQIVSNIKSFLAKTARGRDKQTSIQAKQAILTACTFSESGRMSNLDKIREVIGITKHGFYARKVARDKNVYTYEQVLASKRKTRWGELQKQCVLDFCHSDDSSSIDSNSRKIILVDNVKHVGRVWSAKTIKEQYMMFLTSDIADEYKQNNAQFPLPSFSFFYHNRCPCVSPPVMQSCVDIPMSTAMHYMRALNKVSRKRPELKERLATCNCEQHKKEQAHQWQTYLGRRVEDMVDLSCCPRTRHPHLTYGTGSQSKVPSLLQWKCVRKECTDCGVDRNLQMTKCDILDECAIVIDVLEWINAPRQGAKNGKQNTQLELGMKQLPVKDVVKKLEASLDICRMHMAQYEWRNLMRKIDHTMSDRDKHRVICTDFGATLDLSAAEKDNSSVDNHAVICIFFVSQNWRKVSYKREVEGGGVLDDETIINDCEKWIFFGDTMSKGKKNDHVFHNACQTYLIRYYDTIRINANKAPIPVNITWTDNCPTQYRCRQNFYHISTASSNHPHKPIQTHKLAQKYRFKGSWDATGKVVKQQILQNELKYDRCATALDCYLKLTRDLAKDGEDKKTQKLLEYERNGDAKVVQNTTYTTCKTHIGYGTEDQAEYNRMHNDARYKHIIFTDRQNIPDMKPVPETMKIAQISGLKERNAQGQWVISTSFLPCSCPPCRDDITSAPDNCLYKNERRIKEQLVIPAGNDAAKDDAYGMRSLTVAQLKLELRARDLSTAGLKADLIARIVAALEERDTVVTPEAQLTEHDFEEEDRMFDGEMIV